MRLASQEIDTSDRSNQLQQLLDKESCPQRLLQWLFWLLLGTFHALLSSHHHHHPIGRYICISTITTHRQDRHFLAFYYYRPGAWSRHSTPNGCCFTIALPFLRATHAHNHLYMPPRHSKPSRHIPTTQPQPPPCNYRQRFGYQYYYYFYHQPHITMMMIWKR